MKYEYNNATVVDEAMKYCKKESAIVNAIYSPAVLDFDRGDPYIEALPAELGEKVLALHYYTPFPGTPSKDAPPDVQRSEIQLLDQLRLPLPFCSDVERSFHASLVESYRARRKTVQNRPVTVTYGDSEVEQAVSFRSAAGADTGIGMTLLGIGGCGKSATIERMLLRYPQVIIHDWEEGRYLQIVWIRVVTPANANLRDLYVSIATAIDEALGNDSHICAKTANRQKSVGMMASYIAGLVRCYAIGAIILDEVQNLDSGRVHESSLDSLMTIINTTKVSLVVVGTNDALDLFYRKQYIARRTGSIIMATNYCLDRERFRLIAEMVTEINWFKEPFVLTEELEEAFYEETSGVINRIISLWEEIQKSYVMAKTKPEVTPAFIHQVSHKDNPLIGTFTQIVLDEFKKDKEALESDSGAANLLDISRRKEEGMVAKVIKAMSDPAKGMEVYQKTVDHFVTAGKDYNKKTVLAAVEHVMKVKSNQDASVLDLVQKAVKYLGRRKTDKRSQPAPKAEFDMESFAKSLA